MNSRNVIVLSRSDLIARDVSEEIAAIDPGSVVSIVPTADLAAQSAAEADRLDLLILSQRAATKPPAALLEYVMGMARVVLILETKSGDKADDRTFYVSQTPFSADSLRRDLLAINLDGEPLFPH